MLTEWIILSDYVEFTSGKLYVMGGGWDHVTINHPARILTFGIAAAFRVADAEATLPHDVTISLQSVDGAESLIEIQAQLELGRENHERQSSQLAQLAINLSVEFQNEGRHYITTTLDGREDRSFPFSVRFGNRIPA